MSTHALPYWGHNSPSGILPYLRRIPSLYATSHAGTIHRVHWRVTIPTLCSFSWCSILGGRHMRYGVWEPISCAACRLDPSTPKVFVNIKATISTRLFPRQKIALHCGTPTIRPSCYRFHSIPCISCKQTNNPDTFIRGFRRVRWHSHQPTRSPHPLRPWASHSPNSLPLSQLSQKPIYPANMARSSSSPAALLASVKSSQTFIPQRRQSLHRRPLRILRAS